MGPDERAIREVQATWLEAANAGDVDRLLTLMADDVVFLTPGRTMFGREEFSAAFSAGHKEAQIRCSSELEEIVVVGEVAYTRSRHSVSVTPLAGGVARNLAGHSLTVWRKVADSGWVLARDANLLSPVAKQT